MTSVGFCTLNDAFPEWKNTADNNFKISRSIENPSFPEDLKSLVPKFGNENQQSQQGQQSQQQIQNNGQGQQNQGQIPQNNYNSLNGTSNDMMFQRKNQMNQMKRLPNLRTFRDATACNARNNAFQNAAARNMLRVNQNPLNTDEGILGQEPRWPYYQQFPENQFSQYNSQYYPNKNVRRNPYSYPYNDMYMYPNNILPVNQMNNVWPHQSWYVDPMKGPGPHEKKDPYDKFFSYLGLGNIGVEHFNQYSINESKEVVSNILKLLFIALLFMFIIQIIELSGN